MELENEKKVSIIVPVHNASGTLDRCVNSILKQNYDNIECILVENGSTDSSREMCLEYATQYREIIAVTCDQPGVSNARNKALDLATGDIIGFCDADDFLEENAIEIIEREFQKNPILVAAFCGFSIGIPEKNGNITKDYRGLKTQQVSVEKALQLTLVNDSVMGSVWNKYYRAEVLKHIRFDNSLSFCEDMHFNMKVLNSIQTTRIVQIISNPLYCYMENSESVTHNEEILFDENNDLKYIVALKKIEADCNLDKKTTGFVKMKIACFAIDLMISKKLDQSKNEKLIAELKENYRYLLRYINQNNLKWNIKRVFQGAKILVLKNR